MSYPDTIKTLTIVASEVIANDIILVKLVSKMPPDQQKIYWPKVEAALKETERLIKELNSKE